MSQRPAIRVRVHGDIIEYLESNRSPACLTQVRREAAAAGDYVRGTSSPTPLLERAAQFAERAVWERALGEVLKALARYGRHAPECGLGSGLGGTGPCDCGLARVLRGEPGAAP